jgi:hypothetical protein
VDLVDARTDGLKLSLKLYHARELQLDYQQLMTEASARKKDKQKGDNGVGNGKIHSRLETQGSMMVREQAPGNPGNKQKNN